MAKPFSHKLRKTTRPFLRHSEAPPKPGEVLPIRSHKISQNQIHLKGFDKVHQNLGVSKNEGTPKWMVKIMENPIKIHDLGVSLFLETPKW